jgi:glutamate/tyrosine decarboxylase-like PLP-dependent enzyme
VHQWTQVIEQNVAQIQSFVQRIRMHPDLELLAPAPLNIVCFRYAPAKWQGCITEPQLNAINTELLLRIQERGIAIPSSTMLNNRFALRIAHVNHRTRQVDLDLVFESVLQLGAEVWRDIGDTDH